MRFKLSIFVIIVICIISFIGLSFAETPRLVDIPVPPNSTGYADFTEEEAAERAREYEESKNNIVTSDSLLGKSSDNYLKSLSIEGYELYPKFNRQEDTYTIYVKDKTVDTFNISAEADNENAKVEGIGNVIVSQEQRLINIKVTAENGDLKVYTINIEDEANKPKKINVYIIIVIVVILIGVIIFFIRKRKNK